MKKIILVLIFGVICSTLYSQARFAGYLYNYQTGSKEKFEYSVVASYSDRLYKTTYRLFEPGSSKNRYTITVSHFKDLKRVVMEVNDEQYLLSVMAGKEETTYDQPTLKPFGFRGNLAILDKAAPSQLAVQFLSERYQYVRVLRFLGSSEDGVFQFFMFNDADKITEPKTVPSAQSVSKPRPKAIFHGVNGVKDSAKKQ